MTALTPPKLATAALLLSVSCVCAQAKEEAAVSLSCRTVDSANTATSKEGICTALEKVMQERWPGKFKSAPAQAVQQGETSQLQRLQLTFAPSRDVNNGLQGRLSWALKDAAQTQAKGASPDLGMIVMDRPLEAGDIHTFARQLVGAAEFPFSK